MPDYKRNIRRIVEVQKKMSSCILVKVGEVHLKGLNRPYFEKKLAEHIRAAVRPFGGKVNSAQSRIYVHNISDEDMEAATERCAGCSESMRFRWQPRRRRILTHSVQQ